MFIIENYNTAIFFCFITMLCWIMGQYAKVIKPEIHQLFIGIILLDFLLITLIFGLTLGSNGDVGRSFIDDLSQAELFYMIGFYWRGCF